MVGTVTEVDRVLVGACLDFTLAEPRTLDIDLENVTRVCHMATRATR